MPDKYREQTSPLNVQRIGGVTMAENPVSTRPPLARKPHRYKVDEGLDVRFLCHANSTHVLQTLWRGLPGRLYSPRIQEEFFSETGFPAETVQKLSSTS